ncbi:MFS family permease [Nocardia transvalensis]|uniref:MFS family permease n=1 Tax=Nocardia transvalensis TaxID=37333 RepID=A0A7W9PJN9_9NOCA|nr:MFS transporter [Nocardia transvalensis]MBB5917200.1 MFS family permease [Nocardia transvalensis]
MPISTMWSGPFRSLLAGQLVSLLGDAMAPVALALAVLGASGRPEDLGVVLAAQILPHLALLLVGGAVGDRFSRRTVLIAASCGAGVTQAAVASVLLTGHYALVPIAALEMVNGGLQAFTTPAFRGLIPDLVAAADLQRANALLATVKNGSKIGGPAVAGLLAVTAGGGWAIAADAASFLVAAGILTRLPHSVPPAHGDGRNLLADIREGWATFRRLPWLLAGTVSFAVINLVNTGTWQILGPVLAADRHGPAMWGVLLSVRAGGLLLMSAVLYRIVLRNPWRDGRILGMVAPLAMAALGLKAGTPVLLGCAALAGMGFAAVGITWASVVQRHVPRPMLSRVSAYDDLLSYLTIPIGQLLAGPAAERWGAAPVAIGSATVFLLAVLAPLAGRRWDPSAVSHGSVTRATRGTA